MKIRKIKASSLSVLFLFVSGCAAVGQIPVKYGDMLCNLSKSDPVSAYHCAKREARKEEFQERLRLYEQTGDVKKVEEEMNKRWLQERMGTYRELGNVKSVEEEMQKNK